MNESEPSLVYVWYFVLGAAIGALIAAFLWNMPRVVDVNDEGQPEWSQFTRDLMELSR